MADLTLEQIDAELASRGFDVSNPNTGTIYNSELAGVEDSQPDRLVYSPPNPELDIPTKIGYASTAPQNLDTQIEPSSAPQRSGITLEQIDAELASRGIEPQSTSDKVGSGLLQFGTGMAMGIGDEGGAAGAATIDSVANAIGLGKYVGADPTKNSWSDRYDSYLNMNRDAQQQFAAQNPKTSMGLEIGGAAAGGISALWKKAAVEAPTLFNTAVKSGFFGGTTGGIYGFNSGEGKDKTNGDTDLWASLGERLKSLESGAAWGAGTGLILGGVFGWGANKLGKTQRVMKIKDGLLLKAKEELGAVAPAGIKAPNVNNLSAAEKEIIGLLEQANPDEILAAGKRIAVAEASKKPITFFEALDLENMNQYAKVVRSSEAGATPATRFLKARQKTDLARLDKTLGQVSPEAGVYTGSSKFQNAASDIVEKMDKNRTAVTKPLYKAAAKNAPEIATKRINKVLEHPIVKPLIKEARELYADEIPKNASDNSYQVLDSIKKALTNKYDSLKAAGNRGAARIYNKQAKIIQKELNDLVPDHKIATDEFAKFSKEISELTGSKFAGKRTVGLLKDILSANPENAPQAANTLLKKSPERLKAVIEVFRKNGRLEDLRAGLRSALQHKLDNINEGILREGGGDKVKSILGNDRAIENIKIILGRRDGKRFLDELEVEAFIMKGTQTMGSNLKSVGSNTKMLQSGSKKMLLAVKHGVLNPKVTAERMVEDLVPDQSDQFIEMMAKELFKPATKEQFIRLTKFKRAFDSYRKTIDLATRTTSRSSVSGAISQEQPKGTITPKGSYAAVIGAAGLASNSDYSKDLAKAWQDLESKKKGNDTVKKPEAVSLLQNSLNESGITDPTEQAQFMAQMAHESMNFSKMKEMASGSAYESRKSLGNTKLGDGKKFKGRGFIQLTGRANYERYGKLVGEDLVKNPELAADPEIASKIAIAYWKDRVKPKVKDFTDTKAVTKLINGGLNGLSSREKYFSEFNV